MASGEIDVTETLEVKQDIRAAKLQKLLRNIDSIGRYVNRNNSSLKKKEFKRIFDDAVDLFYSDYEPGSWSNSKKKRKYKRTKDLYNALNLPDGDIFSAETGGEFMQHEHHQENDFVYWTAFGAGSHGGFPNYNPSENNLQGSPGDLYWRSGPGFSRWYNKPAPGLTEGGKDVSIEDIIEKEWHDYLYSEKYEKEFENILLNAFMNYL